MPYTPDQKKLMASLIKQYGLKKAEDVYHGMENSGDYPKLFPKGNPHPRHKKE